MKQEACIQKIVGREILNSRGNPTVEVDVFLENAMILKAAFPEAKVTVDSSCCAGVTMQSHQTALDAMKAVQIEIL